MVYVNPDCIKCISDINLSPDNKSFFTILFIFPIGKSLGIGTLIPVNLLNNPLALAL